MTSATTAPVTPFAYPVARRGDQTDDYFGTTVADPYRWLENPDSPETQAWVDAQIALTTEFLSDIPVRAGIINRLKGLFNYDTVSSPTKRGSRTFYSKHPALANHSIYYVVDAEGAEPRVLMDPNKLSDDGTVALSSYSISEDGNLLAYSVSKSGSDWTEIFVRDINTGEDIVDHLKWIKFSSPSWSRDSKGFYYSSFDEPADMNAVPHFQKMYYHKLGTAQSEDVLVFENKEEPNWHFGGGETEDGQYLIIYVHASSSGNNRIYYKNLATGQLIKLLDKEDAHWSFQGNEGPLFWFFTDLDASRGKLIAVDTTKSSENHLEYVDVIGEPKDEKCIFDGVALTGNRFFAHYSIDVHTEIHELALDGSFIREVKLPGLGSGGGFGGKKADMETYYSFSSYTAPTTIFKYDIATGASTVYFTPDIPLDTSKYTSKLIFATSKDGTRVPIFISYRKGLKRNSKNPTMLYGYGGFNISLGPSFSSSRTVWMDMGGIYAEAILRGGGEYGAAWHQAGTKLQKQNVFDDFIACAEFLISEKYTSTPSLAIHGGSNGGLLVGACMTQRPDLFGACVPSVGVMDMLRFDKFTAGFGWISDYGSAQASKEEFDALYAYSPYHNIKAGVSYPPTMVETADHDDRVVPGHSFKFAAALQAAQGGNAPALIRIDKKAGHGAGKPLSKQIEEIADKYGFLAKTLRIPQRKLKRIK